MASLVINRHQPIYQRKGSTNMKRDLTPYINKVRELVELTRTTGFHTSRSIGEILRDLSPDELIEVNRALKTTK